MAMDRQHSCTSPVSRIWVIETLARSSGVDISLLLHLLEKTPEISTTDLGRNTIELVSFRILECLFIQGSRAYCGSSGKIRLDPSDSCEDVLVQILNQTCISQFGPEVLKWDLWPFIEHKRSSFLTKCVLQKLKVEILTGSHSSFASLREQSGFPVGNQADLVDDGNCNDITSRAAGSNNTKDNDLLPRDENVGPVNRKRGGMLSKNDCVESVKKYKDDAVGSIPTKDDNEPTSSKGPDDKGMSHCDTQLNKEYEERGQDHDTEEAKGDEEGFCAHNITREDMDKFDQNVQRNMSIDEVQEDISSDSNGKNDDRRTDIAGKSNAQCAHRGDSLVKTNWSDLNLLADTSKRYSEEERCSLGEKAHRKVMGQNQPPRNGNNKCTSSKEHVSHDDVLHYVQNDNLRNVPIVGGAEEGVDISSDSDDLQFCVKCNDQQAGKLVVCSSNSCPVVIHERCLSSDASFDTRGMFYCPFCAYSRAISSYTDIKRKASVARKDLATFMFLETQQEPKQNHLEQDDDGLPKRNDVKMVSKRQRKKKSKLDPAMPSELHSGHTLNKDKQERRTRHSSCEVQGTTSGGIADIRHKKGVVYPPETDLPGQGKCSRSSELVDAEETCIEKQVSNPAIPQLRRKRLLWASSEEDRLKEGMRIFCRPHDTIIPWKKILDYGAGIFHHSRTTTDLKDKWRNMCKSTPSPK